MVKNLFKKGDPRINRKGRPLKKDVFKRLRESLELPLEELPKRMQPAIRKYLKDFGFANDEKATLGDCMNLRFFDILFNGETHSSLKAITEFFNRTVAKKIDVDLVDKSSAEEKLSTLSVEQLEKINNIMGAEAQKEI